MAAANILKDMGTKATKILKSDIGKAVGWASLDLGANAAANVFLNKDSVPNAIAKAIPESVAWAVAPKIMGWATFAPMVAGAAFNGYRSADIALRSKYNQSHKAGTMFSYQDTRAALTMRQASVQAIQGSKMNARNALGGEASLMHRNWADRM